MNLDAVCVAVGAAIQGAHAVEITGVSTDNRTVNTGDVFFCIRGEQFDGHSFAASAAEKGAAAIVADRPLECAGVPVVQVDDTTRALGRLAQAWRRQSKAKVVGVTGTAGKTTVKEVLAAVLGMQGVTAKNRLNQNNQIGLPLSMLATTGEEAFWVMEAGISQAGDMDELGAMLAPDVAVVLNAGVGHVAGLGRGVAQHKARLLAWLTPGGTALVCGDYPELVREARAVRPAPGHLEFFTATGKPLFYSAGYLGSAHGPTVSGVAPEARGRFRVCFGTNCREMDAPFRGGYGAENIIAISAAAHVLGLDMDTVARGLAGAALPVQRFACSRLGDWLLVDDSYNANPLSGARMLESVCGMAADMSRAMQADVPLVCVLGEMLELGDAAEEEHETLGRHIAACGARLVIWKGGHGAAVRRGLDEAGFAGSFVDSGAGDVADILQQHQIHDGVILFKGSRGNRLEESVARFKDQAGQSDAV